MIPVRPALPILAIAILAAIPWTAVPAEPGGWTWTDEAAPGPAPAARTASGEWPTLAGDAARTGFTTDEAPTAYYEAWNLSLAPRACYASPIIAGSVVYVPVSSVSSSTDELWAVGLEDGSVIWKVTLPHGLVSSTPAVAGDRLFVGWDLAGLYALNRSDGSTLWRYREPSAVWGSSPVVGTYVLATTDTGHLYAFDPDGLEDGNQGWTNESDTTGGGDVIWWYDAGAPLGTPSILDGVAVVGGRDGSVTAVNASTGAFLWRATLPSQTSDHITLAADEVYVTTANPSGGHNGLYVLDLQGLADGDEGAPDDPTSPGGSDLLWSMELGGFCDQGPATGYGRLFLPVSRLENLPSRNTLFVISLSQRAIVGSYDATDQLGGVSLAAETAYLTSMNGAIYALDAEGAGDLARRWSRNLYAPLSGVPAIAEGFAVVATREGANGGRIVAFTDPPPLPDYAVEASDIALDDPEVYEGERIAITASLSNEGEGGGPAVVSLFVDWFELMDEGLVAREEVNLPPGGSAEVTGHWIASGGSADGERHTVSVRVDVPGGDLAPDNNVASASFDVFSDDWGAWPLQARDPERRGSGGAGPALDLPLWSYELGSGNGSGLGPVCANGTVYHAVGSEVLALAEALPGENATAVLWRCDVGGTVTDLCTRYGLVLAATPEGVRAVREGREVWRWIGRATWLTVVGGFAFAVDRGGIAALRADDGSVAWTSENGSDHPPAADEAERVIWLTQGSALVGLCIDNGTVARRLDAGVAPSCPPMVYNGRLYVGSGEGGARVVCVGPGGVEWDAPVGEGIVEGMCCGNDLVYATLSSGHVAALTYFFGDVTWDRDLRGAPATPPAAGGGRLYVGTTHSGGELWALNGSVSTTGRTELLWNLTTPGIEGWIALANGWALVSSGSRLISVGASNAPPVAVISSPAPNATVSEDDAVVLDARKSTDANEDLLTYRWSSSLQGALGTGPLLSVFLLPGAHAIELVVEDTHGGADVARVNLTVYSLQTKAYLFEGVAFNVSCTARVGGPGAVTFDADPPISPIATETGGLGVCLAIVSTHPILRWIEERWAWDEGLVPKGWDPRSVHLHRFANGTWTRATNPVFRRDGELVVNLTGEGAVGTFGLAATLPQANRPPVANISAPAAGDLFDVGEAILFRSEGSFDPDGDPLLFAWQFGDGASAYTAEASHAYDAPGTYTARLSVSDDRYLVSNATVTVRVGSAVVNTPPTLRAYPLEPKRGTIQQVYLFQVLYTDRDNDPPAYLRVVIDDRSFNMTVNPGEDDRYDDGQMYGFRISGDELGPGPHTHYFVASDGRSEVRTDTVIEGPTVSDEAGKRDIRTGIILVLVIAAAALAVVAGVIQYRRATFRRDLERWRRGDPDGYRFHAGTRPRERRRAVRHVKRRLKRSDDAGTDTDDAKVKIKGSGHSAGSERAVAHPPSEEAVASAASPVGDGLPGDDRGIAPSDGGGGGDEAGTGDDGAADAASARAEQNES